MSKAALNDVFVLTYDRMRKFEGAWHTEQRVLFPGYVILESDDEMALVKAMNRHEGIREQCPDLTRVDQDVEKVLKCLCGKDHHLAMSRGIICKGITQVTEGPLKGMEDRIRKIDRHKRLAKVEIVGGQAGNYIPAGLEIVEKN